MSLGHYLVPLSEGAAFLMGAERGRRWANGSSLAFAELVSATAGLPTPRSFFTVRTRILDSQALIEQLVAAGKRGHSVALLDVARAGALRTFTTRRVIAEVDEHLRESAASIGLPYERVEPHWQELRPRVRTVEIDLPVVYPAPFDREDADDIDLAQLATLLGTRAFSRDRLLVRNGVAEQFDLQVVNALGELASGECAGLLGLAATAEGAAALRQLATWCLGRARRYPGAAILVAIGVALIIELTRRSGFLAAKLGRDGEWRPALQTAADAAGRTLLAYYELAQQLPAEPRVEPGLSLEWNLARLSAIAGAPLSARELSQTLAFYDINASEARVRTALREHPGLFVRNAVGQWQLGTF